jgi:hypothetical protein
MKKLPDELRNEGEALERLHRGAHPGASQPRKPKMAASLKVEKFPGLTKVAPATIEAHSIENALRGAQFVLDMQLLDLKNEFVQRESKLRTEFLDRVARITEGTE